MSRHFLYFGFFILPYELRVEIFWREQLSLLQRKRIFWACFLIVTSSAHSSSVTPAVLLQLSVSDRYIVENFPTFAGVYLNSRGVYVIALAGCHLPLREAVLDGYAKLITDVYQLSPSNKKEGRSISGINFTFAHVKYSLLDLSVFRTKLERQSDTLGLSATSLDYEKNKVLVFTLPGKPALDLPTVLIQLGLPNDAVEMGGILEIG